MNSSVLLLCGGFLLGLWWMIIVLNCCLLYCGSRFVDVLRCIFSDRFGFCWCRFVSMVGRLGIVMCLLMLSDRCIVLVEIVLSVCLCVLSSVWVVGRKFLLLVVSLMMCGVCVSSGLLRCVFSCFSFRLMVDWVVLSVLVVCVKLVRLVISMNVWMVLRLSIFILNENE